MTELPSEEAVETVDENGWTHRRCEGSVPENSKVVGGVLCRYWHEEEPEGVRLINSLDQVAPLLARIAELEEEVQAAKHQSDSYERDFTRLCKALGIEITVETVDCALDEAIEVVHTLTAERDRMKEDKQDLTCEIAECHGELDCRAKDIQRLEGELVKRGDLLDEVLKDAVDAQKRLEAELAEARNKLDLTAMAMFCGTDMPDGHRWVRDAHDETLTFIHFCQWCGVHKVEVPDWLDNPQCPTMAALLRHAPAKEGE